MKGQTSIEYIVAMIIFVIITLYISFQVASSIPYYHVNSLENRLHSDCLRITENMIKNFELEYGFGKEPYELDSVKLGSFNNTCNGDPSNFETIYEEIKNNMMLEAERDFQLRIHVNDSFDFTCGRKYIPSQLAVATMERYAITDYQSTSISLSVW